LLREVVFLKDKEQKIKQSLYFYPYSICVTLIYGEAKALQEGKGLELSHPELPT